MKAEFMKIRKGLGEGRASENAALELEKLIPGLSGRSPINPPRQH